MMYVIGRYFGQNLIFLGVCQNPATATPNWFSPATTHIRISNDIFLQLERNNARQIGLHQTRGIHNIIKLCTRTHVLMCSCLGANVKIWISPFRLWQTFFIEIITWGRVSDHLTMMQPLEMTGKTNEGEELKSEQDDHQRNGVCLKNWHFFIASHLSGLHLWQMWWLNCVCE